MLARSITLLAALAAVAHTPSPTRAKTTIIVEPGTTATTVTVDEHAGTSSCTAPAAPSTPVFANGMMGALIDITLTDGDAYRAMENKLSAVMAMTGSFQMVMDAGQNNVKSFGIFSSPEAWITWNKIFAQLPSEQGMVSLFSKVDCRLFGTTSPAADAAIKMWDKAPGFSVKFTDMVIGKLSDLNGKPDIVGFVLDTEFKSPAAMQGHIDGMLKGVSNGLMMNYGAANAAIVVGPTRMMSFWAFESEADWFAFNAEQSAVGQAAVTEHFVEATTSNWAGAFGNPTAEYAESVAGWNSIPHFDCAIRKIIQGNFADTPTGYFNVASFRSSKLAKKWAPYIDAWKPWGEQVGAVTMSAVMLSPVTMAFWMLFPDSAAQNEFDALISTDAKMPEMFGDMTVMDAHMIGSQTFESEANLKKWFDGPVLHKSAATQVLNLAPLDGPSPAKMQFYLNAIFADAAAADAFAELFYGPAMWNANAEAGSTWFMFREGSTTVRAMASFPSCAAWQGVNAAGGPEIAAAIEGLVLMEGTYWGAMSEPCQKEMDEVWNASPKFNLKASTVSGGYM